MIIQDLFESPQLCPECGGVSFSDLILAEKKDACYYKVKASAKVWPSAYASGRLVQCRKKGAANYGKSKNEGVAEGSLNEFAPGGGEGNGPFDYGRAIVEIGQEFVDYYQDEGAQADAKTIIKVGQTFISAGMKAGIQAFYNLDTQIRDHVAEQLMEQGFNVKQDIYLPYRQQMAKATADDAAEREKYTSSPEYAARRADDLTISAIPDKPINSWSKLGDPAASMTIDRASKRDIKAEFEKFKQDLARRDSLKGVPLRFEITVGGKPVDINSLKEQGVAESFTDDLDNIYAMHPQPEKSEQVVFLITGMTEDEFSDRWTDLPDPYQQEFGYDLPLWDADDLSSYPNLAVKRITYDQYVQLVGNYIKSEELAGSTMSRMKKGMTEGPLQEFAPGGGDGRWYTDDEIADIIGEDWFEFDLSGEAANISIHGEHAKILLVQEAQAYFEDRGYHGVVVQDVRDDEDYLSWYISGNFTRSGVTEENDTKLKLSPPSRKARVRYEDLILDYSIDGATVDVRAIVDDKPVAYVVFLRDGQTLFPDDLAVDEEYRGRSIAKKMYDWVKSLPQGFRIIRGDQTSMGKRFWDKNRGEHVDVWEGVAEGSILKSIKRGLQGWDKNAVGPNGEKLGDPKEIVRRNRAHDDDTLQRLHKATSEPLGFPFGDPNKATKHSPLDLQKRVLDREMRKRGLGEQGVAEAGPFSYGKPPRKGSVADLAAKKRKKQKRGQQPIEPKDQQVGVAKVTEEFGPLPKDNQQIRLGKYTVDIERVGLNKNYIGFAWHDSQGQEHYEEVAVGDLGSYDDLIDRIKSEIRYQERRLKQGVAEDAALAEEFDLIESTVERLAKHNDVDAELIWEDLESLSDDELYVFAVTMPLTEDWQKANKQDRTDGMSRRAVKAYRREHPGSKLKTAVTTKPSKLKRGSKASKRRKSYCSRSRGQMKMHSISCAKTPDKAICKARRRWNCE